MNYKKVTKIACLVVATAVVSPFTSQAAVVVAEYSDPPAPPNRNDVFNDEFISIDGAANVNPIWSFWNSPTEADVDNRYLRFRFDLRTTQYDFDAAGGSGQDTYNVLGTNSTSNLILTQDSDGWANTLRGSNTIDFGTPGTGVPIDGLTSGGTLNWVMIRPDNSSDAAPDLGGGERAVAFAFTWDDANMNNIIDAGDTFLGKYAVTADTFAEIDTVGELNAAVIPEPNTFAMCLGSVALLLSVRRRRLS